MWLTQLKKGDHRNQNFTTGNPEFNILPAYKKCN